MWDNKKPTVQMLGRYQPFHDGHVELFKRAHAKTGQVVIMVRDVAGTKSNPFNFDSVKNRIIHKLYEHKFLHNKDFRVDLVPNIVNITYGRDVGYKIEQEHLGEEIESISATNIRKEMGIA